MGVVAAPIQADRWAALSWGVKAVKHFIGSHCVGCWKQTDGEKGRDSFYF